MSMRWRVAGEEVFSESKSVCSMGGGGSTQATAFKTGIDLQVLFGFEATPAFNRSALVRQLADLSFVISSCFSVIFVIKSSTIENV